MLDTAPFLVVGILGVALGALVAYVPRPTVIAAVLIGPLVLLLAFANFERFVLLLLISRISLDAFSRTGASSVIGALFILTGAIYLITRPRNRPMSPFTKSLYLLSFAAFASMWSSHHLGTVANASSKMLAGAMMFDVLESMLHDNPRFAKKVMLAAGASAVVPIVVALNQGATGTGNRQTIGLNRVFGTAVQPTSLATYLLPILALLITVIAHPWTEPRLRRWALLVVPFPLLVLYLTYTRSAWLVLVVGVAYILWFLRRRRVLPLLAGVAVVAVLVPGVAHRFADLQTHSSPISATASPNSLDWRLGYWKHALSLVGHKWPTGIGFNTTQVVDPQHLAPHNIFVEIYVELGLLGCVAALVALIAFIRTIRRQRRFAMESEDWKAQVIVVATGAAGLMVLGEGMASNVLTQTIVYWYFAGVLGWGLYTNRLPTRKEVASPATLVLPRAVPA